MTGVRIAEMAYVLPVATATLQELALRGQLASDPMVLERFGFDRVCTAREESPYDLALAAGRQLLERADIDPAEGFRRMIDAY